MNYNRKAQACIYATKLNRKKYISRNIELEISRDSNPTNVFSSSVICLINTTIFDMIFVDIDQRSLGIYQKLIYF